MASSSFVSFGPAAAFFFLAAALFLAPLSFDGSGWPDTAEIILISIPSVFILCCTPSSGTPILSILLYLAASFSSSSESWGADPALFSSWGFLPSSSTAATILASTPSALILCRTASGGTPILSILRNFVAIFSSSSDSVLFVDELLLAFLSAALPTSPSDGPSKTARMVFSSTPSVIILCRTLSGGTPIFSILRYFSAAFKSPALAAAAVGDGMLTSTSSISPLGDRQVRRSFVRSDCENWRYLSNNDVSSSVRLDWTLLAVVSTNISASSEDGLPLLLPSLPSLGPR